jgi:ABC-type spermidine/putrescine transport system permease subunit II
VSDIGIIVLGVVVLVVMGFGCRGFFANQEIHLALRIAVSAIGAWVLVLVIRTIRARIKKTKKKDPENLKG